MFNNGDKVKFIGKDTVYHGLLDNKEGVVAGFEPDTELGRLKGSVMFQLPNDLGVYLVAQENLQRM